MQTLPHRLKNRDPGQWRPLSSFFKDAETALYAASEFSDPALRYGPGGIFWFREGHWYRKPPLNAMDADEYRMAGGSWLSREEVAEILSSEIVLVELETGTEMTTVLVKAA